MKKEVYLKTQTLEEFYQFKFGEKPLENLQDKNQFNVFHTEEYNDPDRKPAPYSKKEFFKISLIRGEHIFHYAEKSFRVSGSTLMFFNPLVPYQVESISNTISGYFCIFTPSFFRDNLQSSLKYMPMFEAGGKPAYTLNDETDRRISDIYERMLLELNSDYLHKYDLIRGFIIELSHYAQKLLPSEELYSPTNAKQRITSIFTELLDRQFPIESQNSRLKLRSPGDFANQLGIHVNHLNSAVIHTTGRTTSNLIAERVVSEAKVLLKHTNLNVSEIGYCLGFEDPAHFNHFFKRLVLQSPSVFRGNTNNADKRL